MNRRVLDINYPNYESIPYWKNIVTESIKQYIIDTNEEPRLNISFKITPVRQVVDKFRVEMRPPQTFDQDVLSARVIESLREKELNVLLKKKEEEVTKYILAQLKESELNNLVTKQQESLQLEVHRLVENERTRIDSLMAGMRSELYDRFNKYKMRAETDLEKIDDNFRIINNYQDDIDSQLSRHEELRKKAEGILSNHKNLDGIALGISVTSLFLNMILILYILLA